MRPVNDMNASCVQQGDDLLDVRAVFHAVGGLAGADAGMHRMDAHVLQPVQLFQNPGVRGWIGIAAIAVEEGVQLYVFSGIGGKSPLSAVPAISGRCSMRHSANPAA